MSENRRPIFRLGVVDLGVESVRLPNGQDLDLAIVRHPGACAIVALDRDGAIMLLKQYRHAIGQYLWEIPAGCREPGESAERCAQRELLEEAGVTAKQWDHLGAIVTIPSFCDERIELFLARNLSDQETSHEPDEIIRVQKMDLKEGLAMIHRGEIIDAKTIVGLFRATAVLERGQKSGID